jgi:YD repeat-containing protein
LRQPRRAGVLASGVVLIADTGNSRLRSVVTARGVRNATEVAVPSSDGSLVHIFKDSTKQHLRTVLARTGVVVTRFEYDAAGRVTSMTDADGLRTTMAWDARGPTSVTGPYGHVNRLTVDSNGYLARVDKPGGESVSVAHSASGLLTEMVDETGARHTFQYEADGRLRVDNNPVGGLKALAWNRRLGAETVTVRTAANRTTSYETTRFPDGREAKRITWPDGTVTTVALAADDSTVETSADGTVTAITLAAHARFGNLAPVAGLTTTRLPSGLARNVTTSTAVSFVNNNEAFGVATESQTVRVNGRLFETTYDAVTRSWTSRTPLGRTTRWWRTTESARCGWRLRTMRQSPWPTPTAARWPWCRWVLAPPPLRTGLTARCRSPATRCRGLRCIPTPPPRCSTPSPHPQERRLACPRTGKVA